MQVIRNMLATPPSTGMERARYLLTRCLRSMRARDQLEQDWIGISDQFLLSLLSEFSTGRGASLGATPLNVATIVRPPDPLVTLATSRSLTDITASMP